MQSLKWLKAFSDRIMLLTGVVIVSFPSLSHPILLSGFGIPKSSPAD